MVGGIGFGFFIDELGKFITADNNYFFKPAAALIYLIFIGLFLLARWARGRAQPSPEEDLANAVDLLGDAARGGLDAAGRAHPRRFAIGPHTTVRVAGAFTRPGMNAQSLRYNDAVARAVLRALPADSAAAAAA